MHQNCPSSDLLIRKSLHRRQVIPRWEIFTHERPLQVWGSKALGNRSDLSPQIDMFFIAHQDLFLFKEWFCWDETIELICWMGKFYKPPFVFHSNENLAILCGCFYLKNLEGLGELWKMSSRT